MKKYESEDIVSVIDTSLLATDQTIRSVLNLWINLKEAFLLGKITGYENASLTQRLIGLKNIIGLCLDEMDKRKYKNSIYDNLKYSQMICNDFIQILETGNKIGELASKINYDPSKDSIIDYIRKLINVLDTDSQPKITNIKDNTVDEELVKKILEEMKKN